MAENQKPKFNVLDLIIIIALIALIAGGVWRSGVIEQLRIPEANDTVEITFLCQGVTAGSDKVFAVGDTLYCTDDGLTLGSVTLTESEPTRIYREDADGNLTVSESTETVELRFTVKCTGRISDEGFLLGGTRYLAAGSTVSAHNQTVSMEMTAVSVQKSR